MSKMTDLLKKAVEEAKDQNGYVVIDEGEAHQILALLEKQPEAGNFRKKWKLASCDFRDYTAKDCNLYKEACDIIDRQATEIKRLEEENKDCVTFCWYIIKFVLLVVQ